MGTTLKEKNTLFSAIEETQPKDSVDKRREKEQPMLSLLSFRLITGITLRQSQYLYSQPVFVSIDGDGIAGGEGAAQDGLG